MYGHPALAAGLSVGDRGDGARPAAGACACRPGASRRRPATTARSGARWRRSCARLEAPALDFDADAEGAVARGPGQLGGAGGGGGARGGGGVRARARRRRDRRGRRRGGGDLPRQPVGHRRGRGQERRRRAVPRAAGWRPVPVHAGDHGCASGCRAARATPPRRSPRSRGCASGCSVADDILAALGKLADEAGAALGKGDVDGLGRTFDAAHGLLCALRVSGARAGRAGAHGARRGRDRRQADRRGRRRRGDRARARPRARRARALEAAGFDGFMAEIAATPRLRRHERCRMPSPPCARDEHRAGEVLGQARRRAQPAGDGQPVADAGSARHAHDGRVRRRRARIACVLDGAPAGDAATARVSAFLDRVRARAEHRAPRAGHQRQQRPDRRRPGVVGVGLRGAGAGGDARGRARRCRRPSCRRWRASARARRRARSSAASSRWRAASAPTAATPSRTPLPAGDGWDVRLVVAITATGPKAMGSTAAMTHTARTSPFYDAWIAARPRRSGRPRAPRSPRAICPRWARSPSGARCACTPPRWPPTRPSSTGTRRRWPRSTCVRALRARGHAGLLHHRRRPARQGALPRRRRRRRRRRAARRPRRQRDA